MHYFFKPSGVCSNQITFDISEDETVTNVQFVGGCPGNLKAIGILVEGMKADDIISKLEGNTCGFKPTSCADQLTKALIEAKKELKK